MRILIALSLLIFISSCSKKQTTTKKLPQKTVTQETKKAEKKPPVKIENKEVAAKETIGGGTISTPAVGPKTAYNYGNDTNGYVLVKNWDFGKKGTIKNMAELTENFQYHDQFGVICNGGDNYGSLIVAADEKSSLKNRKQPIDKTNTNGKPIREILTDSMKTYLIPLNGAKECHPQKHNVGCGSFQAKWTLPKGGSRLGMDMIWETRVRYVTPPYFWFAIWTAGNKWNKGAEMDLIESFGYDNGGKYTNYDGRYWHSSVVGGTSETNYHKSWGAGMAKYGFKDYDATKYHTWTWIYRADDTFTCYLDGKVVQNGTLHWTLKAVPDGEELNMSFIFDGAWGHTKVGSVNKPLPAKAFDGKFYEWDFSRVYLRKPEKVKSGEKN